MLEKPFLHHRLIAQVWALGAPGRFDSRWDRALEVKGNGTYITQFSASGGVDSIESPGRWRLSMKNVLVLMHDDAGQEARFQCALDLVRALDGHLTCLDVSILPTMADDYALFGGAALLMADEESVERANRARMEGRLAVEGMPYDWLDVT
ncbi:MAG: hypothetical protein JZU55_07135, partial [Afipia sp.]|nr:hypothetical protein [Afipia sp.]